MEVVSAGRSSRSGGGGRSGSESESESGRSTGAVRGVVEEEKGFCSVQAFSLWLYSRLVNPHLTSDKSADS